MLSIIYQSISFYCYSPQHVDVFIYKFNNKTNETDIVRSHIFHEPIDSKNMHIFISDFIGKFHSLIPKKESLVRYDG